jgi:hypothetical protein
MILGLLEHNMIDFHEPSHGRYAITTHPNVIRTDEVEPQLFICCPEVTYNNEISRNESSLFRLVE